MIFNQTRLRAWSAAGLCLLAIGNAARADELAEYSKLLSEMTPILVTVKFVLKMEGQYGKRESETEITGLMVDPTGLVLCANSKLGMPRFLRGMGSATPTDLKVLVGEDTEGLEAKVLARDTELDLAWVKIKEPGDRKFASLDLEKAGTVKPGERLLTIRRMAKFFDRAATVSEGRLAGRTSKPRDLLIPGGGIDVEPGQAIFLADGRFIGMIVLQLPDMEEMESNPMAFIGMRSDLLNGLILPASEIIKATARAKERKDEDADESAEASDKKDKASTKAAKKSGVTASDNKSSADGVAKKKEKKKNDEDDDDK
jgi:hypothetical protein